MKYVIILLALLNISSCSIYSQKKFGSLVIDEKLTNYFFENPPIMAQEGSYSIYIDSVLVDSNNFEPRWDVVINANIRDLNRKHYSFDTCRSYFFDDTLIIEFRNITILANDGIKVKVLNEKFYPFFISYGKKEYEATPVSLKFRNNIKKSGEKIFGELEIEYSDPILNLKYSFKGPFKCTVE